MDRYLLDVLEARFSKLRNDIIYCVRMIVSIEKEVGEYKKEIDEAIFEMKCILDRLEHVETDLLGKNFSIPDIDELFDLKRKGW